MYIRIYIAKYDTEYLNIEVQENSILQRIALNICEVCNFEISACIKNCAEETMLNKSKSTEEETKYCFSNNKRND